MKAKAVTESTMELPEARILIDSVDGQQAVATGFIIRDDKAGNPVIIFKAGKFK